MAARQKLVGPPEQIPLLREMQDSITALQREVDRTRAGEVNTNKGQNSSLDLLSRQVGEIAAAQQALAEAQAQLIHPVAAHADAGGFGVPVAYAELARCTIAVPAGYTRAAVVAVSGMSARNTLAASDFDVRVSMLSYIEINGTATGRETRTSVYGGGIGMVTAGASTVLTGLGGSMYVRVLGRAVSAFGADALNAVNLDVSVMFLR